MGYGAAILSEKAGHVSACDIDSETIQYASEKYKRSNISFSLMDATNLKFDAGAFDAVVSFETIEHIPDYRQVIKEFHRVLKTGGMLIMSSPNRNTSKGDNEFHCKEFTKPELEQELSPMFGEMQFYSQVLINHQKLWMRLMRSAIRKGAPLGWLYNPLIGYSDSRHCFPKPYDAAGDSDTQNLIVIAKKA